MEEETSRAEHYQDMIPGDGVPLCGFRLLSFIDESGSVRYRMHQYGDAASSHLIGLLEMAKMEIFTSTRQGE